MMIQRVQSIYLLLTLICLSVVTFGSNLISYLSSSARFDVSVMGVEEFNLQTGESIDFNAFYGYAVTGGLMILALAVLLSFKSLPRQFKLGRMLFFTYFIVLISFIVLSYVAQDSISKDITSKELGLGFAFLVMGLPFSFLANVGIKKDKKLIDSLNRLR